jgi:hypothetical protein
LAPNSSVYFVEQYIQPTFTRLASWHVQQDSAHFQGHLLDCPTNFPFADLRTPTRIELKRQCCISRWADNVLGLLDIHQRMGVGAGRGTARSPCSGDRSWITNLAGRSVSLQR